MSIYLHDIPLQEALSRIDQELEKAGLGGRLGTDEIQLDEQALGRVLAEPVWAKISSPNYHAAAMDGFALRSADTNTATLARPVILSCGQGSSELQATYIDTGDPLPDWADTVIPIENVDSLLENGELTREIRRPWSIRVREAVPPWHNVRPVGEDLVASELILPAGRLLHPVDLATIAAGGNDRLRVAKVPHVAIFPSGDELIPVGQPVEKGKIIEFNSIMLAAQINEWGGLAFRYPILPDHFEEIRDQVLAASKDFDLIIINAGSSAGADDYTVKVIESIGQVIFHGVAVRPGHPVLFGMIHQELDGQTRNIPIIGVPGYPVSAALTGEIFIEPILARWLGRAALEAVNIEASLTRKVTSPSGDDDYLRVMLAQVGNRVLAAPLPRGAGMISSLMKADGIIVIPVGAQGIPAGESVNVRLYCTPSDLSKTILATGSHDLALDLIAQYLTSLNRRFKSSNVGSLGGLITLQRDEAHLAGSHLLDPESGEYNLKYIHEYLSGIPVVVVMLAQRMQGLLVKAGNPKDIHLLKDLSRPDVRFINRQRGAGTRVLLDYELRKLGIPAEKVSGYEYEEYTHLAVAAAVASGRADTGLGIAAAANALELEFVPLFREPYHLIIPKKYYQSELINPLLALFSNRAFHNSVANLPGYDVTQMGEVIAEI